MIAVSLQFDKKDIDAYRWQMMRLQTVLKMEPKAATRVAAIAYLKAMAASTNKSRSMRKVTQERTAVFDMARWKYRKHKIKDVYVMERFTKNGSVEKVRIFAKSLSEAKASPAVIIRYSGLAKISWGWAQQRLFNSSAPASKVRKPVRRFLTLSDQGSGQDYSVTIDNTLDYISKAMQGGRGPAVTTALARASNVMRARIEQRLKGAIK